MMNPQVTPETIVEVAQGITPVQVVTLILLGIIAFGFIITVGKWVITLKLGTLPEELNTIRAALESIKVDIARLEGKLWDKEDIQREIKAAIGEHIERCPFHQKEGDKK